MPISLAEIALSFSRLGLETHKPIRGVSSVPLLAAAIRAR
jgi:hypothetical protein